MNNILALSDNGLAPTRRQAIIWTNDGLNCWHIYASLGLKDLNVIAEMIRNQDLYSLRKRRLSGIGIAIIKLRWSFDRLRFIMGSPIPVRRRPFSE